MFLHVCLHRGRFRPFVFVVHAVLSGGGRRFCPWGFGPGRFCPGFARPLHSVRTSPARSTSLPRAISVKSLHNVQIFTASYQTAPIHPTPGLPLTFLGVTCLTFYFAPSSYLTSTLSTAVSSLLPRDYSPSNSGGRR